MAKKTKSNTKSPLTPEEQEQKRLEKKLRADREKDFRNSVIELKKKYSVLGNLSINELWVLQVIGNEDVWWDENFTNFTKPLTIITKNIDIKNLMLKFPDKVEEMIHYSDLTRLPFLKFLFENNLITEGKFLSLLKEMASYKSRAKFYNLFDEELTEYFLNNETYCKIIVENNNSIFRILTSEQKKKYEYTLEKAK